VRAASHLLGFLYGLVVLVAATLLAAVIGLVCMVPFVVLPRGRRERYTVVPASWWAHLVLRGLLFVRPRVDGTVEPAGGAILLCNHRSWVDPLLLMAHTRSNGLSKAEIFWIPFVGLMGWLSGAVYFDRRSGRARARARQEVITLVRAGHRVQVFPEGTRSRTGELAERVYLTAPMDAYRAGLPVVCCAVWGTERVLPPNAYAAWPGQEVRLSIGPTLHPRDFPTARAFAQACWAEVTTLVAAQRREAANAGEVPEAGLEPALHEGRGF
jgi:1-acyl-sn-glycerol-3-phosphate acyltransferase